MLLHAANLSWDGVCLTRSSLRASIRKSAATAGSSRSSWALLHFPKPPALQLHCRAACPAHNLCQNGLANACAIRQPYWDGAAGLATALMATPNFKARAILATLCLYI